MKNGVLWVVEFKPPRARKWWQLTPAYNRTAAKLDAEYRAATMPRNKYRVVCYVREETAND